MSTNASRKSWFLWQRWCNPIHLCIVGTTPTIVFLFSRFQTLIFVKPCISVELSPVSPKKKNHRLVTQLKRIFKPSVSSPCFSVENLFWATGWSHHITSWSAWFGDKCCWTCQKPAKTQRVRNECLQLHSRLEIRILDTWLRTKSKAMG